MKKSVPIKILLSVVLTIPISSLIAKKSSNDSGFGQCNAFQTKPTSRHSSFLSKPEQDAIYLEADRGTIRPEGITTLDGHIAIQQNSIHFSADSAQFNRRNNQLKAQGNVVLSDSGFILKSPSIKYNIKDKTGIIEKAEYSFAEGEARGSSKRIEQIDENRLRLNDATYTSCPITQDSWHFGSTDIRLNKASQIGHAKNVTFKVGKIPVFYFPWLRFPLNNQRLSGFLTPSIRLQNNAGITLPYYFNLAPNYDATLRLKTLSGRGIQLDSQFRYLSDKHKGEIEYDLIPQDKSFDDEKRDHFKIKYITDLNEKTQLKLNAEGVSDTDFFDDFSNSLETSTRPALQRRLELATDKPPWSASIVLEDFQVIDATNSPYAKLPELKLGYAPVKAPKELKLSIDSELTFFDRNDDVTGTRGDIKFKLSKKWGDDSWYLKPTISLQHTLYALNNSEDSDLSRTLPTITLDSGLFFDRQLNSKLTHTLEPRLFYTHTPFKNQSKFPVFDSATTNFSASNQLFLENRFTGKDRIADTNQLTFALTSRLQDRNNGKELFKASIGQIYHFSDRKVTLDDETFSSNRRSELVLELSGRLTDKLRLSSTSSWDTDSRKAASYDFRLHFQDDNKRIANLGFRKLESELKQLRFSTSLPINDKWSFISSFDQDLKNNRNLESLMGIEYQDCCWKTRLVVKQYLTSDNIHHETPIFLEFELKGLGNLGTGASRQIKEKIYGYDDY